MQDNFIILAFTSFTIVLVLLVAILIVYLPLSVFLKKRRFAKLDWQEDLAEGGIEEPHPIRDLDPIEEATLSKMDKNAMAVRKNFWLILPISFLIDVFIVYFIYHFDISSLLGDRLGTYLFIAEFLVVSYGLKERNRYLDLISPVFKVQGEVVKEVYARKGGTDYYITVRKLKFSNKDFDSLPNFYQTINDGDEVAVEYSPRTKHVWKIYRTEDLK